MRSGQYCREQQQSENRLFHVLSIPVSFACILLLVFSLNTHAESGWSIELSTGFAHNFDRSLTILQAGQPTLRIVADYDTHAFSTPLYYSMRAGRWIGNHAWEVEFMHHKIFLTDTEAAIQRFAISHGYNHLMLNYAWRRWLIFRIGAGVILAHPESEVRNAFLEPGYEWTGPCGQFSIAKRIYFADGFSGRRGLFAQIEGKMTIARAHVSISNGSANAPVTALHGVFGLGYGF